MGNKCCHEEEKAENVLHYMKAVSSKQVNEGRKAGRQQSLDEEFAEKTSTIAVNEFQTHKRNDKGNLKKPQACERKKQFLIRVNTEANVVNYDRRTRQMSLELKDSINCTFLEQYKPVV